MLRTNAIVWYSRSPNVIYSGWGLCNVTGVRASPFYKTRSFFFFSLLHVSVTSNHHQADILVHGHDMFSA